jgi:hypothetical protein
MSGREAMVATKVDLASGTSSLGTIRADRVGATFFDTIGARLRLGREFTERDHSDDARVLIVNEAMASQVWPGEDPLGRPVELDEATWQDRRRQRHSLDVPARADAAWRCISRSRRPDSHRPPGTA